MSEEKMNKLMRYLVERIEDMRMGQYWTVGDKELWTTDNVRIGGTPFTEIIREFPNRKMYRIEAGNAKMHIFLTKMYDDKTVDEMPTWMEEYKV